MVDLKECLKEGKASGPTLETLMIVYRRFTACWVRWRGEGSTLVSQALQWQTGFGAGRPLQMAVRML